jgi:phospholipase C
VRQRAHPQQHDRAADENRSYDHWLGARGLIEGKPNAGLTASMANADASGSRSASSRPSPATTACRIRRGWDLGRAVANGANTRLVAAHQQEHPGDVSVIRYMTRADRRSRALADAARRAIAGSRRLGPTWPNRMYWMTGTSMGVTSTRRTAASPRRRSTTG